MDCPNAVASVTINGHHQEIIMPKNILIAYFSHGGENLVDDQIVDLGDEGNTKIAAKKLAALLGEKGIKANLFEI